VLLEFCASVQFSSCVAQVGNT